MDTVSRVHAVNVAPSANKPDNQPINLYPHQIESFLFSFLQNIRNESELFLIGYIR